MKRTDARLPFESTGDFLLLAIHRVLPAIRKSPVNPKAFATISFRGVAGVQTPAFVERRRRRAACRIRPTGVAGVQTPAFVERFRASTFDASMHRPRVAGVQTPAFVERKRITIPLPFSTWCRRSSDSGLAALWGGTVLSPTCARRSRGPRRRSRWCRGRWW